MPQGRAARDEDEEEPNYLLMSDRAIYQGQGTDDQQMH